MRSILLPILPWDEGSRKTCDGVASTKKYTNLFFIKVYNKRQKCKQQFIMEVAQSVSEAFFVKEKKTVEVMLRFKRFALSCFAFTASRGKSFVVVVCCCCFILMLLLLLLLCFCCCCCRLLLLILLLLSFAVVIF